MKDKTVEQVPKIPKIPKITEIDKVPKLPEIPKITEIDKVPKLPEIPKLPEKSKEQGPQSLKKKRGFKPVISLKLPPGMDKFVNAIKAPLQEVEKMIAEEDRLVEEDIKAQQAFHSMSL